jgi:transcriptional regulator with XRE-family HTH domain
MSSPLAARFGANLRRARQGADLTQEGLAHLVELSRCDIGQLERGLRLPRLDTILKLSAGVARSPCVLLAGLRWQPGYQVEGQFSATKETETNAPAERPAG